MAKVDTKDLEKALAANDINNSQIKDSTDGKAQMPKDAEIGFHEGALNTLINERNELFKMIQNVEAVMQMHMNRLKELGIDIKQKKE